MSLNLGENIEMPTNWLSPLRQMPLIMTSERLRSTPRARSEILVGSCLYLGWVSFHLNSFASGPGYQSGWYGASGSRWSCMHEPLHFSG